MNKRIRYIKDEFGGLKSLRAIKSASGLSYIAHISPDGKRGSITTATKSNFFVEVSGTSPHKVKIALKTVLEQLKCPFFKESRKKRKGEETPNGV